jgi:hypothetical protein
VHPRQLTQNRQSTHRLQFGRVFVTDRSFPSASALSRPSTILTGPAQLIRTLAVISLKTV